MQSVIGTGSLYVAESGIPGAGRGVFAKEAIMANAVIEECPVIFLTEQEAEHVSETTLVTYIYFLGTSQERAVMVLGYGSIYNHSDQPNAKYVDRSDEGIVAFVATKDIPAGVEIVVDYAPHRKDGDAPLWIA